MDVVKRNGKVVEFDRKKIKNAISKSLIGIDTTIEETQLNKITKNILQDITKAKITVEEIQDIVENNLMKVGLYDVAKSYILYREEHNKHRINGEMPESSIQDYIFTSRYSRYLPSLNRRETYNECVDRVKYMHIEKYPNLINEIEWVFDVVKEKRVLPSMRSLQFGGKAINQKNERIYNCSASVADRKRFFQESIYMLLCGVGVGFSVEFEHVDKMPKLADSINETEVIHHTIADSIEGWSDAVGSLVNSYFNGTLVEFNYSEIRKKGEYLKTSGGKAPGHVPLRKSIEKVRSILDKSLGRKLKPIEVYDIVMHLCDAVLAGGIRRSACICFFSATDSEMMNAKTGNWFEENPQRGRSNNSAKLIRSKVTKSEFEHLFEKQKEWGEPGFYFAENVDYCSNPCQPEFAKVLTIDGIRQFKDIDIGSEIWSETGWTKVIKKWSTGVKPVNRYTTTAGSFIGTKNHRIVSKGTKVEVGEAISMDLLQGPIIGVDVNPQDIIDGLVIGDESSHPTSVEKVYLTIGANDTDYFNSEVSDFIGETYAVKKGSAYKVKTTITMNEVPKLPVRIIPHRFYSGGHDKVCGFLRGLYSANGSICGNRVTLKSTSKILINQAQEMLSSVGIRSYITANKASNVKWKNGTYESKKSYDLNITSDRYVFMNQIGFIHKYKTEKLSEACSVIVDISAKVKTHDIISIEYLGDFEVFDITVDNEPHTYWTGGINVSNCVEIGLNPFFVNDDGEKLSGWAFCNLTEINGAKIKSKEDFKTAVKAGAIIGTLQASYTDFPYIGKITEEICRREPLLGVSITGMMDSPDLIFNADLQKEMAEYAIEVNKEFAEKLGINQAPRVTCVKPAGSTSLVLGTASGIHPRHAKQYFRRVQANTDDNVYQHFNKYNSAICEPSVWSANNTDDVVNFCVKSPEGAIVKSDISALDLLEKVKLTQNNWVKSGTAIPESSPNLLHNVSNTITVKEGEWDYVKEFIWGNRNLFTGISMLSDMGDKMYQQAPHEEITTVEDIEKWNKYCKGYKVVDYTAMREMEDNTAVQETIACSGGSCELK